MNAEIYFPRNGKAFGQTSEKSFDTTVKKLGGMMEIESSPGKGSKTTVSIAIGRERKQKT